MSGLIVVGLSRDHSLRTKELRVKYAPLLSPVYAFSE